MSQLSSGILPIDLCPLDFAQRLRYWRRVHLKLDANRLSTARTDPREWGDVRHTGRSRLLRHRMSPL